MTLRQRKRVNGLALCAGIGGMELGLRLALGRQYRTVCYVERDAYAASVLVARMEDKIMDTAPVWDNITTFDGKPWRGVVDIITAGFPCQPVSVAGKRRGQKDARWLWPHIDRIIREIRPSFVFLENVPGLLARDVASVLGSLAACGYDAEWDVFSAAQLGAPHLRKRWFCLAAYAGCEHIWEQSRRGGGARRSRTSQPSQDGEDWEMADADRERLEKRQASSHKRWAGSAHGGWWKAEPSVGRVADGVPAWVDRLRCLGNGVVPQVAAAAWDDLMARLSASIPLLAWRHEDNR